MTNNAVQFGCGLCAPENWRNFDCSPALRLQRLPLLGGFFVGQYGRFPANVRYGDIVRGLPLQEGSCQYVYSSHVLEHLSLKDFRLALKEVHRLLAPSGVFRFVMPDLEFLAQQYLQDSSPEASVTFMQESYLGVADRPRGMRGFLKSWLGNSHHLWMWDEKSMRQELERVGFQDARRASYHDSTHAIFLDVESEERWTNALAMECIK